MTHKSGVREKILKVFRLAQEGVGGEKIAAEKLLYKLLDKYDLDISYLEDLQNRLTITLEYDDGYGKALAVSIISQVLDVDTDTFISEMGSKDTEVSGPAHKVFEIEAAFSVHYPRFKEALQNCFLAYLIKNQLGRASGVKKGMTAKQVAAYEQAMQMADSIDAVSTYQ